MKNNTDTERLDFIATRTFHYVPHNGGQSCEAYISGVGRLIERDVRSVIDAAMFKVSQSSATPSAATSTSPRSTEGS